MRRRFTVTPQGSASGIYKGDVTVSISVEDPLAGGTYSGLKTVSYRVLNMGQVTQSGTLYTFNNANPAANQLQRSWNGQITVDSTLNNSNDVVIEVYGEFMFEVSGDSTKPHNVKIVGVDSAGNETVVEIKNFYVTTNLLVRYYNNKPLFFGSIFGIIAFIAFIIFLIVYRRRKREQERF